MERQQVFPGWLRCALILSVGLAALPARAQNEVGSPDPDYRTPRFWLAATVGIHPLRQTAQDSLPEGMPLLTRAFWGRNGAFRKLGLGPSTRAGELRLRRSMLQWHQRLGLATWLAMTAQVTTGGLVQSNPARYYDNLQPVHKTLGYVTFGAYSTTAGLSIFAPPARRYGSGLNSIKLHRYLALIHFSGMMAQPWLGAASARATDADRYDRLSTLHKWVGIATYTAFTGAILTIWLPI